MNVLATRESTGFKRAPLPLPPGNSFTRQITARLISRVSGGSPHEIAARMWPGDRMVGELLTRAASAPAMVSVPSWAGVLAHTMVVDVAAALGPASAGARLLADGLLLDWNGAATIGVPALVASSNNAGFVKEGDPIPVRQFNPTTVFLNPYKLATIVGGLTREMIESSNAEAFINDTLIKSAGLALDAALFSTAGVSSIAPAGLLYGIAPLSPSANADPFGSVFEDVQSLIGAVSAVGGSGPYYIIGTAANIAGMFMRFDTDPDSSRVVYPVVSGAVGANLIAVAAQAVAAAMSLTPDLETSNTGTLVMDTVPGPAGSAGPEKSLFQTDSIAIKMRWPVSWILRDPRGVAWLTPSWK